MTTVPLIFAVFAVLLAVLWINKKTPKLMRMPTALQHASDAIALVGGEYTYNIQPVLESDPALSVFAQSKLPNEVVLWVGFTKKAGFVEFQKYIEQAGLYPNITHVYVYDEVFWGLDGNVHIGLDEAEILKACRVANAAYLVPVVSMLPEVVLHPDFRMADINQIGIIGLDLYPSIRVDNSLGGYSARSENLYINLVDACVRKLRDVGYTGDIWYLYQGFGLHSEPADSLRAMLEAQRQAVNEAASLGVVGVMPWGLYLGAAEIEREPDLFPLAGTEFEELVKP